MPAATYIQTYDLIYLYLPHCVSSWCVVQNLAVSGRKVKNKPANLSACLSVGWGQCWLTLPTGNNLLMMPIRCNKISPFMSGKHIPVCALCMRVDTTCPRVCCTTSVWVCPDIGRIFFFVYVVVVVVFCLVMSWYPCQCYLQVIDIFTLWLLDAICKTLVWPGKHFTHRTQRDTTMYLDKNWNWETARSRRYWRHHWLLG